MTVIDVGFFSINALWKNKIAVLVGDYLLSKGLLLIDNDDFDLLKIISVAVREMSEGELLQIEKARRLDITEDILRNNSKKDSDSYCRLLCLELGLLLMMRIRLRICVNLVTHRDGFSNKR
jgi:octaprenyl-diphosphate synthase